MPCVYNKTNGHCLAKDMVGAKACHELSSEECGTNVHCVYNSTDNKCVNAEPNKQGACSLIELKDACDTDLGCTWNDATNMCESRM